MWYNSVAALENHQPGSNIKKFYFKNLEEVHLEH